MILTAEAPSQVGNEVGCCFLCHESIAKAFSFLTCTWVPAQTALHQQYRLSASCCGPGWDSQQQQAAAASTCSSSSSRWPCLRLQHSTSGHASAGAAAAEARSTAATTSKLCCAHCCYWHSKGESHSGFWNHLNYWINPRQPLPRPRAAGHHRTAGLLACEAVTPAAETAPRGACCSRGKPRGACCSCRTPYCILPI